MELKTFVDDAISQLIEGVAQAQSKHKESGAIINPSLKDGKVNYYSGGLAATGSGYYPTKIDFDVAVTVSEDAGAKAGIQVFGVGLGGNVSTQNSVVSRLQFSVSVALPKSDVKLKDGNIV